MDAVAWAITCENIQIVRCCVATNLNGFDALAWQNFNHKDKTNANGNFSSIAFVITNLNVDEMTFW